MADQGSQSDRGAGTTDASVEPSGALDGRPADPTGDAPTGALGGSLPLPRPSDRPPYGGKLPSRTPPPPPVAVYRSKPPGPIVVEPESLLARRPLPPPRAPRREDGFPGELGEEPVAATLHDEEPTTTTLEPEEEAEIVAEDMLSEEISGETEIDLFDLDGTGAPPGIPSLAQEPVPERSAEPERDERDDGGGKVRRRKGSKRRHRRTVRIPDDAVPATPAPPAVAALTATEETELSAEDIEPIPPTPLPAPRTPSGTLVMKEPVAPQQDQAPAGAPVALAPPAASTGAGTAPVPVMLPLPHPPPAARTPQPPAVQPAVAGPVPAPPESVEPEPESVEPESVEPEPSKGTPAAATPAPAEATTAEPQRTAAELEELEARTLPPPPDETSPGATPSPVPAIPPHGLSTEAAAPPVASAPIVLPPPTPPPKPASPPSAHPAPSAAPASAPRPGPASDRSSFNIVTDRQSVGLILPIDVSSDLPAVEPKKKPVRPVPPRRADRPADALEVIDDVEAVELPAVAPAPLDVGAVLPDDATSAAGTPLEPGAKTPASRRPPPPRRPRGAEGDALEVDVEFDAAAATQAFGPSVSPDRPEAADATPSPTAPQPHTPSPPPVTVADVTPGEAPAPAAAPAEGEAPAEAKPAEAKPADAKPTAADAKAGAGPKGAPKRKKPWWVDLFEDDFTRTLDKPIESDVKREASFIERLLNLAQGARVLDLGCGMGRHAVELASRGYQVVGVDISQTMLDRATEYALQRRQPVNFVKGDMRKLSLDAVFDGIFCWAETFGYFDEQTNLAVLESIHRALRPGGTFALDVANRDFVAPRSPTMVWFEQEGCVCMDEMKFDFYTSRMVVKRTVLFQTGRSRELEYSIRMYSLHELGRVLHQSGFRVLEVSGHRAHPGAYFGSESPRLIIAAERT
jgi:SAM-dependent methyltransferase